MITKSIKTQEGYEAALAEIETLIDLNPQAGTPEANQLELVSFRVEQYESERFPIGLPDPVEAIEFRMEQRGLTPRDLIPYIGSRSKVSEILSRKRSLTLTMIRALHEGLGIPAEALLEKRPLSDLRESDIEWERFPWKEILRLEWIKGSVSKIRRDIEGAMRAFFAPIGIPEIQRVLTKKTEYVRSARAMDQYALATWTARIMTVAMQDETQSGYQAGTVTIEYMREIAHLSRSETGPLLAQDFLRKSGISLVIEPHLSRTYLDGAAMVLKSGRPAIGLTLRYDRIDNFWYCLMHELAHVALHLGEALTNVYDDLDMENGKSLLEREADEMAIEALVPKVEWVKSAASRLRTPEAVRSLADKLNIHPAIVAGHIRHHYKSYRVLKEFVGYGEVRQLFPQCHWKE